MEPEGISLLFPPLGLFIITLIARATFSFLETSITALRLFKLKELEKSLDGYTQLFNSLEKEPQRVLITILVGNSIADVLTAALAPYIMTKVFQHFHLSSQLGFSIGLAVALIAILIFGEIIPKALAKTKSERLFLSTLWLTNILFYFLYPLITPLLVISNFFTYRFGNRSVVAHINEWVASEREVRFLIDYIYEKGLIEADKNKLLQNIFDLGKTPVREIMIPMGDTICASTKDSLNSIVHLFLRHHFSRLPIYESDATNIIGIIYLKDLFTFIATNHQSDITKLIRPIIFVPESMKVNQLLKEFQNQQMHLAMITNEHGSITGLITLEDVLEEIVGDINDEHEEKLNKIIPLKPEGWLVHASTSLDDITQLVNIRFESGTTVTLGGFITEQLQHIPKPGEQLTYKNYKFTVKKASKRRVLQVLVRENISV
jgi:putative hemolysin